MENPIVLYQSEDGQATLEVRLQQDTVWLTQAQIAELFGTKRPAITKHLRSIFATYELNESSVCSVLEHTANDGKVYNTKFYSLDAIISVGYRVNSRNATQFRIWANKVLKDHLVNGYTLNEQRLRQQQNQLDEIQQTLLLFQRTANDEELKLDEAKGLLALINDYAKSFSLLNQFDTNEVPSNGLSESITYEIDYTEAVEAIQQLRQTLVNSKEASDLFGKKRSDGFRGILGTIVQTFDGANTFTPPLRSRRLTCCILSLKIIRSATVTNALGRLCLYGFWRRINTV